MHLKAWLLAARPKTLPAAIVPVWSGCLYAQYFEGVFDLRLAVLTVLGAILIQIATNFFNDVIDAEKGTDTAARLGPQRMTSSGLLSPKKVYLASAVMLICAIVVGFLLIQARGWWVVAIGLPSLYLSYGYTGGPFPLAYRGLGEVFVILFFGLIAVGGSVFVQTGQWLPGGWILGLQIGLLSAVLIAINNYRDVEEDRAAGKNTIVVRFGRPAVRVLIFFMTIAPYILIPLHGVWGWMGLAILPGIIFSLLNLCLLGRPAMPKALLGLAALHLILFVVMQHFVMTLTYG
ncbi:1,4-dihydroxy-2-naphthoate octaprenyltransferase [Akkermansiaceae bacterium]|nr:1,4-dihydroxy-2-naphthoate octaprenyltransferase [bacterium]MDB4271384.1 1,4-dihydroxy-2-naphthoate octaprenyltransferase [Akkermansiaceae bacterium]MDB4273230.1 1,4-dihydroxy-2-naphthoate octaprenyltransferase [Akkermansiaceae bacterium]MDB4283722.1 1,4-dihydroxy-2-naphthoate octaprenyltransferase [Akkermansiaceae bacterium]MDB4332429.1 1,4-dihydroxy-2-naphthoate octaprenyltransferase [Akkermansiaceae bacterium]